jgi:hypothetical protein
MSILKTSVIQSPDSDTPQILLSASGLSFSASALELTGGDLDLPDGTTIDGDTIAVASDLAAKLDSSTAASTYLPIAGGKILQIVRATDSTQRVTTSTSYVDASISVTITPQKNDSAILLLWSVGIGVQSANQFINLQITDNSNNPVSGAEETNFGSTNATVLRDNTIVLGRATPGTTNATTYKGRFKTAGAGGDTFLLNNVLTGQIYAIEVSA